jgi:hypothetical protein
LAPNSVSLRVRLVVSIFVFLAAAFRADASTAETLAAQLTYPTDGATNAEMSQPMQWTTVIDAQAYYLYVGSTLGAKDLVDSGELQPTSYLPAGLPRNQTVFARIWTKVGGFWRSNDSSFTTSAAMVVVIATVTSPVNGATNVSTTPQMQWTTVLNAQAYYLYIGSTPGTKDLVDSGELQPTSYVSAGLPGGQAVFARLWTKVGGIWRSSDSSFTTSAATVPVIATLTSPVNGATNVNMSQPMQWTTVLNAQAYYLYVGSTLGSKDFVDTSEIQQTSYLATSVPSGQTVFARLWTKVGGVWRSSDSSFATSAATVIATLTSPVNGATNVNMSESIQWTTVLNTQAYYLYVGSTLGAKDLVDSGELQPTYYLPAGLPRSQTVFARLWTKVGGFWRSSDSSFTTSAAMVPVIATVTSPVSGATNVSTTPQMQWTTVLNAQAYYLYIGSTPGTKDLVDSGELQPTSYVSAGLPSGQTVFARLWTKVGGLWRSSDSSFTTLSVVATLTYPPNGAVAIDLTQPATWTSIVNAQAYYLYIGSTQGAKDILDSEETFSTTFPIVMLPADPTLYARLWTKTGTVWRYSDSTFTASRIAPEFANPTDGAVAVDAAQLFRWTSPANADAQQLFVGTSAGGNDLFDSGLMLGTSAIVNGLPPSGTLYARALSRVSGTWRYTDIAFTLEASSRVSSIVVPSNGQGSFDTVQPFEWSVAPLGRGYRLTIGTSFGGNDLHDSGEIHVTRRFVPNLPIGLLFGRVQTKLSAHWYSSDFTFFVGANTVSAALQITSALWATDVVRQMALTDNLPFSWTVLASTKTQTTANCSDYAGALLTVLAEMNVQLPARRLQVALNPNGYDGHTLIEMFDSARQNWMLLDPTFDVTIRRTATGNWATAEDVSTATRAQRWSDVSYVFLGQQNDYYTLGYYLDYPLLFVNIYHAGQLVTNGAGAPVLQYLAPAVLPVTSAQETYMIGCSGVTSAELLIDGTVKTIDCSGVDHLSQAFSAASIGTTTSTPASLTVYRPIRFVF